MWDSLTHAVKIDRPRADMNFRPSTSVTHRKLIDARQWQKGTLAPHLPQPFKSADKFFLNQGKSYAHGALFQLDGIWFAAFMVA